MSTYRREQKVISPIALSKSNQEKENSTRNAMLTPAMIGISVAYTCLTRNADALRGINGLNKTGQAMAECKHSNSITVTGARHQQRPYLPWECALEDERAHHSAE